MYRTRPIKSLLLTAVLILVVQGKARAKQQWVRVTSEDVVVYSDASSKSVADFAFRFSSFRRAFIQMLAPPLSTPPPIVLILFNSEHELSEHLAKRPGRSLSYFTEVDNSALIGLADGNNIEFFQKQVFQFEAIWSLRRAGYILPRWMELGTAVVMASAEIDKSNCVFDGNYLALVDPKRLSWNQFFDSYEDSPEFKKHWSLDYSDQARSLMSLILLQDGDPRERFEKLAKNIQSGRREQQAVEEFFGGSMAEADAAMNRLPKGIRPIKIAHDKKAILAGLRIEPADEAEVNVMRSNLLFACQREKEGETLIDGAAVLSPQSNLVIEALARRELRRGDTSAAAAYYRRAIAAGSLNPNAWIVSAYDHLEQGKIDGSDVPGRGGQGARMAIDEIHRALQLDPGDLNAWRLLGRAYYVVENVSEKEVSELSHAITNGENGLKVRYYRGLVCSRLGRLNDALADMEYLLDYQYTPQVLRTAASGFKQQLRFLADKLEVENFLAEGNCQKARQVIDRGLGQNAGTPLGKNYEHLGSMLLEISSWAKAVDLSRQKDWSGTLAAVNKFIDDFPSSAFIQQARNLASDAGEHLKLADKDKSE